MSGDSEMISPIPIRINEVLYPVVKQKQQKQQTTNKNKKTKTTKQQIK
jgi:hypothetical protein